jgi:hypothetical protein
MSVEAPKRKRGDRYAYDLEKDVPKGANML